MPTSSRALCLIASGLLSSVLACLPSAALEPSAAPEPAPTPETPAGAEPLAADSLDHQPAPAPAPVEPEPIAASDPAPPGFEGIPLRSEYLPSGLELHDYALGSGRESVAGDRVSVHYVGWLVDGTEFDSTYARSTPFESEIGKGRLIEGFERGLHGVRPGMRRKVVIPPALGYGERGAGKIPALAVLVFYLEVISVSPP